MGFFVILVVLVVLFVAVMLEAFKERDDTDPPNDRSGMVLFIDHRTGCHYVGTPHGGITPRLDRNGEQICDPKPEGAR
ncbi:hypothetical protein [Rhizobium leguminosarum]|uniref:hypothetical protein n=1 Tax=Rhizobium leguminosarum TaxID=384 RepID=UPI000379B3D8|nr:hypothetical protein [Rhizobium leguminosarum]